MKNLLKYIRLGNQGLLDYLYHQKYYKQINFAGNLKEDHGATIFFIAEKQQKAILNFSLDSLIVTE